MNPFKLTIQARLYGTLALTVVLLVLIGSLSVLNARTSIRQLDAIVEQRLTPADWLSTLQLQHGEVFHKTVSAISRSDVPAVQSVTELVKERTATGDDLVSKLQ